MDAAIKSLHARRDKVEVLIAEKKLELFDLGGAATYAVRRWNLNEIEGRYAKTNIPEPFLELELGLKRADGNRQTVGRFRLDLNALTDAGFVTRRTVDGNYVFDVQIYRSDEHEYSLGVRQHHTTPLAQYAVPTIAR